MQPLLDIIFRRQRVEPPVPLCPAHKTEMHLRGKMGRPTRFTAQTEEQYTLIYFCPVDECNETVERKQARSQIPVPGEPPLRPTFARMRDDVDRR